MIKKFPTFRVFVVIAVVILIVGEVKLYFNGYRFFCEGLEACDRHGKLIPWDVFWKRQSFAIAIVVVIAGILSWAGWYQHEKKQDK